MYKNVKDWYKTEYSDKYIEQLNDNNYNVVMLFKASYW